MENFSELGLAPKLLASLEAMKFTTPTPIQVQAIPSALEGKDILGSAQTGTGKTGAFGIPLVNKLLTNPRGSALVLTPTRELAVQVMEALKQMLGKYSTISTALLIGGESMPKQIQALRARPRLIVGTPGRINDHLDRGTLGLHDANFLVLDETDRMLDMGFGIQLDRIMKFMTGQRQTLLFSATLPSNIVKLSEKFLTNPVRVSVGSTTTPITRITQEVIRTNEADKYEHLVKELEIRTGSVVVFVKTKFGADRLAEKLNRRKMSADAIHGDLQQNRRDRVLKGFRESKFRILVATDLAARGLDIPHIEHVINYDLPQCPEDYIHRIGRTARAGAEGAALCLLTPQDGEKWYAIQKLINPEEAAKMERPRPAGKPGGGRRRGGGGGGRPGGAGGGKPAFAGAGAKKPFQGGARRTQGGNRGGKASAA